jgi:predicted negative regulator of RcsB-dependent stress response
MISACLARAPRTDHAERWNQDMNRKWAEIMCLMVALTTSVEADDTNAIERLREADRLMAVGKYTSAAELLTAVISTVSNSVRECYAKARLASCLYESGEYDRAISLCDEVANKWPRGSTQFAPFMIKADCLTAVGKTNEAVRAYRDHYTHHNPDVHVADEDIQKRMEAIRRRRTVPTPRTVP